MGKLYEINTDYLRIIEAVEEAEGELTPELEEQLAANGEDFREKIENYLMAVRNYEADKTALKEALKAGEQVEGAQITLNYSLQIK